MSSDYYGGIAGEIADTGARDWSACSDPPAESCGDAACPVHGWTEIQVCRVHGQVSDDHFPCRVPGETDGQFTARALGETRDV